MFNKEKIINMLVCMTVVIVVAISFNFKPVRQVFNVQKPLSVILDAGHGEPDGGAVGVNGTLEKDINLAIVLKMQEILESRGVNVILTRTDDHSLYSEKDSTIREKKKSDMNRRAKIMSNSKADLFISIHMNSFSDSTVNGLHLFYDKNHPEIEELTQKIQEKMGEVTESTIHAVKTADTSLFLMKNSPIPAILIECGFLSNPKEEQKLTEEDYQSRVAWSICEALFNEYTNY